MSCHCEEAQGRRGNLMNAFMRLLRYARNDIFLIFALVSPMWAAPPSVKIEPLTYNPPRAERVVLKNGLVVYIQEDPELPLIEMTLRIKSSPAFEAAPDVFEIMGSVWRVGGTKTLSPTEVDRALENMATNISVSVDEEAVNWGISTLTKNSEKSFLLLCDLMFQPRFDPEQLAITKDQALEGLRRQNESIADIGRRAFRDVLFGPSHVYAQNPTLKTIGALTREHLFATHKKIMDPQGAIVSISGDFKKADMIRDLERWFGTWTSNRTSLPPYDFSLRQPAEGEVFFVEKDFTQSRILMGRVGPLRHNPDEYALRIGDAILGGGGPSRLFSEIRSRQGLAYMVGSVYTERQGPGTIAVVCQTMAPATLQAVKAIVQELEKFGTAAPSLEELNIAKESAINSFVFAFLTPGNIVSAWAQNEFYGYPPDYLEKFNERIAALNPSDILAVAKKYYSKAGMKIVVVGDSKKIGASLDALGKVTKIPLDQLE